MTNMAHLKAGEIGIITDVTGKGAIRQRLLDMGILPKETIQIERVAPTGDPIWIKLNGYQVSLRKKEAERVKIHR